ncbi:MAG: hypothetical protein WDN69_14785 [Aliidongia sp.]
MTQDAALTEARPDSGDGRRRDIIRAAARLVGEHGYAGTLDARHRRCGRHAAGLALLSFRLQGRAGRGDLHRRHRRAERRDRSGDRRAGRSLGAARTRLHHPSGSPSVGERLRHGDREREPEIAARAARPAVGYRDRYEAIFVELVAALDLPPDIDRSIYRLSLLSTLNAVSAWYRPGGRTPDYIARQIFAIYDHRDSGRHQI